MGGKQDAQWNRKRQHPLARWHARDDVIDQVRGGVCHAPRPARTAVEAESLPACLWENACADRPKRDRWQRLVCTVHVDGIDVGLAQVAAGMAWWYRRYAHEQSAEQRPAYSEAEL